VTLRLNGSTSGYTEIDAPAVAGSNTLVLPTGAGSAYQVIRNGATAGSLEFTDKIVSGTAVASTSGTSIDFTGIPSWVKRVTVMFSGVSTNGTSSLLVQVGAGSVTTTGYISTGNVYNNASGTGGASSTAGFLIYNNSAANTYIGAVGVSLFGSNQWIQSHNLRYDTNTVSSGAGSVTLSGALDRVRITTVNGTDTFDAGSINILYE
jgi:hypothetical protein